MSKTNNYKPKVIGLTGGLASGKTLVLNEFKKHGIKTISCDEIAKEIYNRTDVRECIKKHFGTLNRKKIAKIIFSDAKKKKQLEDILHPQIIKELKKRLSSVVSPQANLLGYTLHPVVVDAPLLFEADIDYLFDKIIVVYCRKNQQLRRLCIRDNISLTEAGRRIGSQIPLLKKIKWADYIIDNTGARRAIEEQVGCIIKKISVLEKST